MSGGHHVKRKRGHLPSLEAKNKLRRIFDQDATQRSFLDELDELTLMTTLAKVPLPPSIPLFVWVTLMCSWKPSCQSKRQKGLQLPIFLCSSWMAARRPNHVCKLQSSIISTIAVPRESSLSLPAGIQTKVWRLILPQHPLPRSPGVGACFPFLGPF